jgi:hypothetical protein
MPSDLEEQGEEHGTQSTEHKEGDHWEEQGENRAKQEQTVCHGLARCAP